LLAIASVEGEEFTAEVVARVLAVSEASAAQCLSSDLGERHRLVIPVSLRRLRARKISRYRFLHSLFQRYLYDHLDAIQRANLHQAVSSALEALHDDSPDELEALAPRLAWHCALAGLPDRSATYHLRAGKRATEMGSHQQAIDHLTLGLAVIEALPATPERVRLRFNLQLAVAYPVAHLHGFWAPERIQALERAYEFSQHPAFADSVERWKMSAVAGYFALWSAEPERTRAIGEQLLRLTEQTHEPQQLRWAHGLLGCAHLMRADLTLACEHLDRALVAADYRSSPQTDLIAGIHLVIEILSWQSFALWQRGYPDHGAQRLQDALKAAQDSGSSVTLALVQAVASTVLFLCARDAAAASQQIKALRQSDGIGLAFGAWADSLVGHDAVEGAQDDNALQKMRQGLTAFQVFGSGLGRASQLLLLARGYADTGQTQAGLNALDEALRWMDATGVRVLEAETHRLRGELLLNDQPSQGDAARSASQATAAACFQRAIAVARQHGARWWELRATVSLCRLLKERGATQDGDRAEARLMLAEIYDWFSEGFDAPDLREARALLEVM
jgi:tetratricopeptide (TPR) repeat protein